MDWNRALPTWPMSELSRRVRCRPHQWHVQEAGSERDRPTLLLLHGAGASTHTWRDMIPPLEQKYHVVALDLPGQGFTKLGPRNRCGLVPMAQDIALLCQDQGWAPSVIIGHSAGAAIALHLSRILPNSPRIVGINAALGRFDGVASWLFPLLAKVLSLTPLTALAFTAGGNPTARARRLIEGTGSQLPPDGLALYGRLVSDRDHVDGVLQMMSQWDVGPLLDALPQINAPCLLLTGDKDSAVAPQVSAKAVRALPHATLQSLGALGHLAHEEDPALVTRRIFDWIAQTDSGS
ncbi:alpha/beta fold hydrolase BchO [Sagittula marina]|uniref:alpha/beta fold hydrolase BchO n=2 Tax=Sagittula marina TaxID=943940 RepID=UPI0016128386|nr:alpha/beta fold hydrolase BchO [Sagittula marina]